MRARAEEGVPVRMWKCHYPMQCSYLLSKTQPLYMKSFPCVTWLQRGAASRKPGIKIIAPALMTCDEVDISFNLATQVAELMTFLVEAQVFQYSVFQSFGRWRL